METILGEGQLKPNSLNPISLAYIGDAVYEILVREHLALNGDKPPEQLHKLAVNFVSAKAQAAAIQKLMPILTEDEISAFKRGRNAKVSHIPKGASPAHYHNATGFESLFGHLYLTEQTERIRELFKIICEGEQV